MDPYTSYLIDKWHREQVRRRKQLTCSTRWLNFITWATIVLMAVVLAAALAS